MLSKEPPDPAHLGNRSSSSSSSSSGSCSSSSSSSSISNSNSSSSASSSGSSSSSDSSRADLRWILNSTRGVGISAASEALQPLREILPPALGRAQLSCGGVWPAPQRCAPPSDDQLRRPVACFAVGRPILDVWAAAAACLHRGYGQHVKRVLRRPPACFAAAR